MKPKRTIFKTDLPFMLLFPLVTFYFEILFHISTVGSRIDISYFYIALFSFSFGAVGYLLTSISKSKKVNYYITLAIMSLMAVMYLIFYFIYKQFKIVYDLNTVFGGAGDAVGGFGADIIRLVFCFDGIFKILLYFVPVILFAVFGRNKIKPKQSNIMIRSAAVVFMVVFYLLGVLFVSLGRNANLYKKEYEFNMAVGRFGLLTGLRLDAKNILFGSSQGDFETEQTDKPQDDTPKPVVYPENVMQLDFSKPCSGTIKSLNDYVATLAPTKQNKYTGLFKDKNLIMISAEAFSAEVINPELTPTLYRLATKGINFTDYYQPASAGTTGGEYQNIFGLLPSYGGGSFNATVNRENATTIFYQLNKLGYYGQAFHNNSYTYYNRNKR